MFEEEEVSEGGREGISRLKSSCGGHAITPPKELWIWLDKVDVFHLSPSHQYVFQRAYRYS